MFFWLFWKNSGLSISPLSLLSYQNFFYRAEETNGFHYFRTNAYKLHYFETASGKILTIIGQSFCNYIIIIVFKTL
jgi:hypothetical protein